ncbi:MAG TPA: hypothetical protein VNF71_16665 [Acidimicrobiales bacterium]|nr:hypothetical protein [Acidimicrobiales bacterium]
MALTYPTHAPASPGPRSRIWWQEQALALAPAVLTLLLATSVWLLGWRGVDQAAQLYRVTMFRTHGLMIWDAGWYGGNFPLGYSVLFPPLASLLGIQVVAVASAAIATLAFDRVIRAHFGSRPLGTWYFAVSTVLPVMIGQLPFLAGEAAGLVALIALQKGQRRTAVALGVVAALFSPLAAAFLAMACLAWAARGSSRRGWIIATAAVSLGVIFALGALFPGDGPFPFPWQGLVVTELLCFTALTPFVRTTPAVRLGALIYAAASFFSFVVPNPLGGNAPRLAGAIGVPLLACFLTANGPAVARFSPSKLTERILRGRRVEFGPRLRLLAVAIVLPFAVWQWAPGQKIVTSPAASPSVSESFYQPLISEIHTLTPGPVRVEIPPTLEHWESAYVAPYISLARGWERQLDIADNPLFYTQGALTPASYEAWLDNEGVSYVALPNAQLDYAAQAEGRLLESGQIGSLVPVWGTAHWQLWRVNGSPGLVTGSAVLTTLEPDHLVLEVQKPGPLTVRVRYTAFWSITTGAGCVGPAPGGWTSVQASLAGPLALSASLRGNPATTCATP